MTEDEIQAAIDEATFEFSVGNPDLAATQLNALLEKSPGAPGAWHALSEVELSRKNVQGALKAAQEAHRLNPNDLFINTTLSRIWVELGDKTEAEKFGAQAKMLSWKDQIQNPADYKGGLS